MKVTFVINQTSEVTLPHSAPHRPRPLASLGPEELSALHARHDPRHRIVVDTIGDWQLAVLPHGSPRWQEQRARGCLDLMLWNPEQHATLVTASPDTDGQAEVRVGRWVGRFCGVPCACRWLVEAHQLPVPHPDVVQRARTHLVLAHSLLA
jgi:hypothetical protein